MNFFGQAQEPQIKTVGDVFATFTAELEEVTEQHKQVANDARAEQEFLENALATEQDREQAAEAQVSQAAQAMKNIGELLGIKAE